MPELNKPFTSVNLYYTSNSIYSGRTRDRAENAYFWVNGQLQNKPQVDWDNGDLKLREFYKRIFQDPSWECHTKYGEIHDVCCSGDEVLRTQEDVGMT